jgi:glycosyltransferase involved in cell wall biosynthesis
VLEAGVIGKPVLITDQCGFDSVATIGGGKVVPASIEGLQQGLMELLDSSDKLESMGKNLKKFVNESFLWDSLINKYVSLYKRIIT